MPPAKLDLDMIVTEAIALMDEVGLPNLSLRKLAARLDVQAPSLYRHITDKAELELLMSHRIFRQSLDRIPPCDTWQEWLREFAMGLWAEHHRSPGSLELIAAHHDRGDPHGEVSPQSMAALTSLGLPSDLAFTAQASVQALATGWSMLYAVVDGAETERFTAALETMIKGCEAAVAQ